jgi:hypothetical protein
MTYKEYKKPRKTVINKRDSKAGEYHVYTVTCPFCNTRMQGDFHGTLMFQCWTCKNSIDLRGKDGKPVYKKED